MTNEMRPARFAYVGSYTRPEQGGRGSDGLGISVYAVAPETGALTLVQTVAADNPSWVELDPTQRFLYAAYETGDYEGEPSGAVAAFAVDAETGHLTPINVQSARGVWPAHIGIDPTGAFAVVADYEGPFVVLPIREDGGLEPVRTVVQNEGTGPDAARQEKSHPHAATFDPSGRYVVTADLGTDAVQVWRLTQEGALDEVSRATLAPGAGPRHVAFLPDARFLYVLNEMHATVTAFPYDAETGQIGAEIQTISMLPDDFADLRGAAEIVMHPSGRLLYASNRGSADAVSSMADSIAAYTIDGETGRLTLIGFTHEGILEPRGVALDPTGTWLYVANQRGDDIVQFVVDQKTGALSPTGVVVETPTPVDIAFLRG